MTDARPPADPRTRAADLYARHAAAVEGRLLRRYPGVDPERAADAVADAVLDFDGDDEGELYEEARQRLRVFLRSEKRRKIREGKVALAAVTNGEPAAPEPEDDPDPPDPAAVRDVRDRLARTDAERAALTYWLDGVTAPADMAVRLGYGTDPAAVSAAKTLMARLRKRMERERARRHPEPEDEA